MSTFEDPLEALNYGFKLVLYENILSLLFLFLALRAAKQDY